MKQNNKKIGEKKEEYLRLCEGTNGGKRTTTYSTKNGNFSRLNVCVKYQTIIDVCRDLNMNKNQCIELLSVRRLFARAVSGYLNTHWTLIMYISLWLYRFLCKCIVFVLDRSRYAILWLKETKYIFVHRARAHNRSTDRSTFDISINLLVK